MIKSEWIYPVFTGLPNPRFYNGNKIIAIGTYDFTTHIEYSMEESLDPH